MFFDCGPILLVPDILRAKQNLYKQPGRIVLCLIKHRKSIRKGPWVEHKYFCKENNILQNTKKFMKVSQSFQNLSWSPHQWHYFVVNKLHPRFDEATKLSCKLREGGNPNHGSLPVAKYECLWPQVSCVKAGGFLGQLFLHWPSRWSSLHPCVQT